MMNHATTSVKMQPTITSSATLVLPRGDPFLDDRRLQVELHPRRDRRADQADHHVEVAVVPELVERRRL